MKRKNFWRLIFLRKLMKGVTKRQAWIHRRKVKNSGKVLVIEKLAKARPESEFFVHRLVPVSNPDIRCQEIIVPEMKPTVLIYFLFVKETYAGTPLKKIALFSHQIIQANRNGITDGVKIIKQSNTRPDAQSFSRFSQSRIVIKRKKTTGSNDLGVNVFCGSLCNGEYRCKNEYDNEA